MTLNPDDRLLGQPCEAWAAPIVRDVLGTLDPGVKAQLAAHLADCGPCRKAREHLAVAADTVLTPERIVELLNATPSGWGGDLPDQCLAYHHTSDPERIERCDNPAMPGRTYCSDHDNWSYVR